MKYVLQCEDSIEGIFSAVYAAWELKYGHENTKLQVLGVEGANLELFATYIPLKPDTEKAKKSTPSAGAFNAKGVDCYGM